MSRRLQDAVKKVTAPPELAERIQAAVAAAGPPPKYSWVRIYYAAAIAAVFFALVAGAVKYQQGYFRLTAGSKQSYIETIASRIDHVMSLGLCDHVECAVFRDYPGTIPTLAELGQTMGPADKDLLPAVEGHVPADYRLVMAHHCEYKGRPFAHLTFRKGTSVLSLVVAKRGDGESFDAQQVHAAATQAGLTLYQASVQRYQIAAFETPGHLVYIVSDLTPEKNLAVLADLAPSVRAALRKSES